MHWALTRPCQAWLKQTLKDMPVDLQSVAEGNLLSSLQVHCTAMVFIAAGGSPLTAASCPETLLMDVEHLNKLRREFECLATVSSMMSTTRRYIVATGELGDLDIVREVSDALSACTIAPTEAFVETIAEKLERSSLNQSRRGILVYLLEQNADPSDSLRQIL